MVTKIYEGFVRDCREWDSVGADPSAEMDGGPEVIRDAQRLISLCRKMCSKIAQVISNRTRLHHVRLLEELNTGIRHNPPLVAEMATLGQLLSQWVKRILSIRTFDESPRLHTIASDFTSTGSLFELAIAVTDYAPQLAIGPA
jgi:hypothetical protein